MAKRAKLPAAPNERFVRGVVSKRKAAEQLPDAEAVLVAFLRARVAAGLAPQAQAGGLVYQLIDGWRLVISESEVLDAGQRILPADGLEEEVRAQEEAREARGLRSEPIGRAEVTAQVDEGAYRAALQREAAEREARALARAHEEAEEKASHRRERNAIADFLGVAREPEPPQADLLQADEAPVVRAVRRKGRVVAKQQAFSW